MFCNTNAASVLPIASFLRCISLTCPSTSAIAVALLSAINAARFWTSKSMCSCNTGVPALLVRIVCSSFNLRISVVLADVSLSNWFRVLLHATSLPASYSVLPVLKSASLFFLRSSKSFVTVAILSPILFASILTLACEAIRALASSISRLTRETLSRIISSAFFPTSCVCCFNVVISVRRDLDHFS